MGRQIGDVGRVTVSLEADVLAQAQKRAAVMKYPTFSEYVAHLIEADLASRQCHTLVRGDAGATYGVETTTATASLNEDVGKKRQR